MVVDLHSRTLWRELGAAIQNMRDVRKSGLNQVRIESLTAGMQKAVAWLRKVSSKAYRSAAS